MSSKGSLATGMVVDMVIIGILLISLIIVFIILFRKWKSKHNYRDLAEKSTQKRLKTYGPVYDVHGFDKDGYDAIQLGCKTVRAKVSNKAKIFEICFFMMLFLLYIY